MGHVIFVILHILAVLFGLVGLVITIPLHLIYAVVSNKNKPVDVSKTRVCPFCKETVLKEAIICKHCGKDLPEEKQVIYGTDSFGNKIAEGLRK